MFPPVVGVLTVPLPTLATPATGVVAESLLDATGCVAAEAERAEGVVGLRSFGVSYTNVLCVMLEKSIAFENVMEMGALISSARLLSKWLTERKIPSNACRGHEIGGT